MDNPLNGEITSTEIAAVFAYDLGFAKPFVLLGYEATRFEMTYDEFTDDTNEEFDVETIRLGLIRNF
jgi:hypothetical protein